MTELESAESLALAIDTGCSLDDAVPLILADRNAVRVALIGEIRALANKYAEHRSLYGDALEFAFDETQDKCTQPKEPKL